MQKIEILKATSTEHLEIVRDLFTEYQKFLGFSLCFQGFDEELAKLPYKYAEPEGTILLAKVDEKIAGVVALWKLSEGVCEMKRLYLKPEFKGLGLGRKLAEAIIREGKNKGYQTMKLDTLKRLESACNLYKKLGFQETQPYSYNPESDIMYFEKTLKLMTNPKIKNLLPSGLLNIGDLLEISEKLNAGGCGILPTDTGYLFACDATNVEAIKNIFRIKGRREENPIHVCIGNTNMIDKVGKANEQAKHLFKAFFPGAMTVVVPKQGWLSDYLVANSGNIGIRIPDEPSIIQICNEIDKPITATSVNLSGTPPLSNFDEIIATFGEKIDFAVKANRAIFLKPSTIVRIIGENVEVLREGPISSKEVFEYLHKNDAYDKNTSL